MSEKQRAILAYLRSRDDHSATKSELVDQFGGWYYRNGSKQLGDVLTRMVRSRLLWRPKRGLYKITNKLGHQPGEKPSAASSSLPGQLSLFK